MKITLSTILAVLIVGGGTYYLIKNQKPVTTSNTSAQLNTSAAFNTNSSTNRPQLANSNSANSNSTADSNACVSADLAATLINGQGTAGTYYYTLALKNTGAASCLYSGSTSVSLQNATSAVVGTPAVTPNTALTIPAGQSIYAGLGFPSSNNFTAGTCTPGVKTLAVYPPAQSAAVVVTNIDQLYPGWTNFFCPGFSAQAFSTTKP